MALEMYSYKSETSAMNGRVFSFPDISSGTTGRVSRFEQGPQGTFRYSVLKRGLDIFLVLLFSPILLLIVGIVASIVRFTSPGPIFFSHRRIRAQGGFFSMWKFRTMCVDSAEVLEAYLQENPDAREEWLKARKLQNDPRVTQIGNFLRRTSLDEIPQLWNVFTGSMSLVGPRPIVAAEVEKYGKHFVDYCLVKPGITGLWQVSGRSSTTYQQRLQLDSRYVHDWTFLGDIKILFKTFSTVLKQDGAY
jgi:lipopolysaccharide/colanic/teichoic acid biosynthesis glycosyltransferase